MQRFVTIVNRGTVDQPKCTSIKKAQIYIERGFAEPALYDLSHNLTGIRMLGAAEQAFQRIGLPGLGRSRQIHELRSSSFEKTGRTSGASKPTRLKRSLPQAGRTPEELHWRESVLARDGYKCVFCGSTEKLEADHIKPKAVYPDLKYDVGNGRTLCNPCHRKTDTYGGRTAGVTKVESVA